MNSALRVFKTAARNLCGAVNHVNFSNALFGLGVGTLALIATGNLGYGASATLLGIGGFSWLDYRRSLPIYPQP